MAIQILVNTGSCYECTQRWVPWFNGNKPQPSEIAQNWAGNTQLRWWHTARQCCFEQQNEGSVQNCTLPGTHGQLWCTKTRCAMENVALTGLLHIVSVKKPSPAAIFRTQPGKWAPLCALTLQGFLYIALTKSVMMTNRLMSLPNINVYMTCILHINASMDVSLIHNDFYTSYRNKHCRETRQACDFQTPYDLPSCVNVSKIILQKYYCVATTKKTRFDSACSWVISE